MKVRISSFWRIRMRHEQLSLLSNNILLVSSLFEAGAKGEPALTSCYSRKDVFVSAEKSLYGSYINLADPFIGNAISFVK
jgi:hypothetical protein